MQAEERREALLSRCNGICGKVMAQVAELQGRCRGDIIVDALHNRAVLVDALLRAQLKEMGEEGLDAFVDAAIHAFV